MSRINYYRVTAPDRENFSQYGDTIAIKERYDTDVVFNLTTGKNYTLNGEVGTPIPDIANFPLTKHEQNNLAEFRNLGWLGW